METPRRSRHRTCPGRELKANTVTEGSLIHPTKRCLPSGRPGTPMPVVAGRPFVGCSRQAFGGPLMSGTAGSGELSRSRKLDPVLNELQPVPNTCGRVVGAKFSPTNRLPVEWAPELAFSGGPNRYRRGDLTLSENALPRS